MKKRGAETAARPAGYKGVDHTRPNGGSTTGWRDACQLSLEWVNLSRHVQGSDVFTPRCAHAIAALPVSHTPGAFMSIGGCSETEYFPLHSVSGARACCSAVC
jgi:hypothetical protein